MKMMTTKMTTMAHVYMALFILLADKPQQITQK